MAKQLTFSYKVSEKTQKEMIEYFKDKKREKTPPYAIFQANEADTVITLYESGKVVFQGISADIDANMWKEREKSLTGEYPVEKRKEKKKPNIDDKKDFTPVIKKALELGGYKENQTLKGINGGTKVTTGFGHSAILSHANTIVDAVKSGAISHFFLVAGCDGAKPGRNYYTDFVKQTPSDSIILTLACGKFRFNDLNLGEINGLPRLMDMGQCNDAYGAIQVALALADAFGCTVNELPLSFVLSWYEQKAVCILLTLLHLGIKNIRLGPSLPAFLSPNILNLLVEKYGIAPITTPEEDIKALINTP